MVDFEATECDAAFGPDASQSDVFKQVTPLISQYVNNGTNCTLMTYGPEGSGKTHTLLGATFKDCLQLDTNVNTPIGSELISPTSTSAVKK